VEKNYVTLPQARTSRHIFNQYVIRVARRNELQNFLKTQEIGTEVYYPVPMHLQECFKYLGHGKGDFPESEKAAMETIALPIYPELNEAQARHVVEIITHFYTAKI
jgi:dTDP-4-amino-4,6-dideoxygalactose transaminase